MDKDLEARFNVTLKCCCRLPLTEAEDKLRAEIKKGWDKGNEERKLKRAGRKNHPPRL